MTFKEVRSEIELELKKQGKDRFVENRRFIEYLIHSFRARGIEEQARATGEIDISWIQDFGRVMVTKINSADDPNVPYTSMEMGKVSLPEMVSLPEDKGLYRVSSSSRMVKYFPIPYDRFFEIPEGSEKLKFDLYYRVGRAIYITPYVKELNIGGILMDPMDGYVLNTTNQISGDLEVGTVYLVSEGAIVHNGVNYTKGQTFTAVNKNFTGTGVVRFNEKKRKLTENDVYPITAEVMQFVRVNILEYFGVRMQQVDDITVDGQDESKLRTNQQ